VPLVRGSFVLGANTILQQQEYFTVSKCNGQGNNDRRSQCNNGRFGIPYQAQQNIGYTPIHCANPSQNNAHPRHKHQLEYGYHGEEAMI